LTVRVKAERSTSAAKLNPGEEIDRSARSMPTSSINASAESVLHFGTNGNPSGWSIPARFSAAR
jgi:hypothetical protein